MPNVNKVSKWIKKMKLTAKQLKQKTGYILLEGEFYESDGYIETHNNYAIVHDKEVVYYIHPYSPIDSKEEIGFVMGGKPVLNADNYYVANIDEGKYPLISFECVKQLWGEDVDFKVVDFKEPDSKSIKKKDVEKYREMGYTVSDTLYAHKAGGCLVKSGNLYGLFGFDDDEYFGMELPAGSPKSIEAAYKLIQPKEITAVSARQGEWYFQKCDEPPFSPTQTVINPSIIQVDHERVISCQIYLTRKSEDSNIHKLSADKIIIDGNKYWADSPIMEHSQHPTVSLSGWHLIMENLAVKSVSTEGVD